ncbi:arf-GAP with dual PH domain-containing protein 1 isoform X15 [Manis javanica]|uniref:arf-GAP with dual PH domain-containing protein 1 isoform X15 n=1 Tax=Manis javanica TaxID=9974 RepID=UPI003C6D63B3
MAKERRRAVLELLQRPGNSRCADCGAPDPEWASYTLGVFICLSCSGVHRNIPQVSKVKSVRLDAWEEAQVEFMASHGNNTARDTYESKVPPFYYRPTFSDCHLLREQWIRAKYERREFTHPEKQEPYSAGWSKQGSAAPCWAPQAGQAGHQDPSSCFSQMLQEDAPGILGLMARISRGLSLEAWQGQRAVFKPEVCADGTRGGLEVFQQKRRQGAQGHHEDRASECHLPASQNRPPPRPAGHLPEGQQHPEYLCLPRGREGDGGLVQRPTCCPLPLPAGGVPRGQRCRPGAQALQELFEGRLHGEDGPQAHGRLPETLVHHG